MKTSTIALALLLCLAGAARSQEPKDLKDPKEPKPKAETPKLKLQDRYGHTADPKLFPQSTPKKTLESIIKAILDEQYEYMLAHLADPKYVDDKVERYMKDAAGRQNLRNSAFIGRMGATVSTPDDFLVKKLRLPADLGLVIDKVNAGSPAAKAGIKEQDVLVFLGGRSVPNIPAAFLRTLGNFKDGARVEAVLVRNGEKEVRSLVLPEFDDPNRLPAFGKLVKETINLYFEDAVRVQELRKFAREAEWTIEGNRAYGVLKQLGNRQVILRLDEERWFLENRQTKEK